MLGSLRAAVVKKVEPRIGDRTRRALRQLEKGRPGNNSTTLVDSAADAGLKLGRELLGDLDTVLMRRPQSKVAILATPLGSPWPT